jgi:hypothetical protein
MSGKPAAWLEPWRCLALTASRFMHFKNIDQLWQDYDICSI